MGATVAQANIKRAAGRGAAAGAAFSLLTPVNAYNTRSALKGRAAFAAGGAVLGAAVGAGAAHQYNHTHSVSAGGHIVRHANTKVKH